MSTLMNALAIYGVVAVLAMVLFYFLVKSGES